MHPSLEFERLYRRYHQTVAAYISARVPSRETAEDLCHDVFMKLSKALETYDDQKASASTLLYRIAHNAVIDYYRIHHPHSDLAEWDGTLPSTEDVVMDREKLSGLADALRQLPREQRDVLILRFYQGWPLTRIAKEMGIKYHTAVSRQKNGLEGLRKILSGSPK